MKKITLSVVIVAILLLNIVVRAQESVTVSSYVADKYLAFGTGSVLSKDSAIQSDTFVSFRNGAYVDFWNSKSLNGKWNNGSLGNEVDYAVGWKGVVAEGAKLNIGTTYFDESKAFTFGAGDIVYSHVFLTRSFKSFSVTAGYENYTTMPKSGFHGGNLVSLGTSSHWSFCEGKIGTHVSAVLVYDTGTIGTGHGFIARGNAGLDWNVSKKVSFNLVGANWFMPLTAHDRRTTDAMVYTGLTLNIK